MPASPRLMTARHADSVRFLRLYVVSTVHAERCCDLILPVVCESWRRRGFLSFKAGFCFVLFFSLHASKAYQRAVLNISLQLLHKLLPCQQNCYCSVSWETKTNTWNKCEPHTLKPKTVWESSAGEWNRRIRESSTDYSHFSLISFEHVEPQKACKHQLLKIIVYVHTELYCRAIPRNNVFFFFLFLCVQLMFVYL